MNEDDQKPDEKPGQPSAEQAADLANLTAMAAEGSSGPAGAPAGADKPGELPPPSASAMASATMLVGMVQPLVLWAVPHLKGAPKELWDPIPEGVACVLDHVGMGESDLMRNPWMRLAVSTMPLVAVAVMTAPEKPKEPAALPAPGAPAVTAPPGAPAAPGSNTVTFGGAPA